MASLRRRDRKEQEILDRILEHCREVGVSIRTRPTKKLGKRQPLRGCYIPDDKTIWIARSHKLWFEVLLHEYCHLCQELDGEWFAARAHFKDWTRFDDWLDHAVDSREATILDAVRVIQACELDCERRVVALARQHQLPSIDAETYIKKANAYVWSYEAARITRRWATKKPADLVLEILALMPSHFIKDADLGTMPEGYLELYIRKCVPRPQKF